MTLRRGEHPDELISAAVSGELTDDEQARLDAHLATCETCRQTLAAWTEQRRLVAGLRGAPVPRDLAPRIRAGIESGAFAVPWWRRTGLLVGVGATVATAAAALLAVAVIGNLLPGPQVASTTSPTQSASASIVENPTPSATESETVQPTPSEAPIGIREPVARFTYRVQDQQVALKLVTDGGEADLNTGSAMVPVDAALSPDGDWLAFRVSGEQSGLTAAYVYRQSDGRLIKLDSNSMDSPFVRFSWSNDGQLLAYTHYDPTAGADVYVFDTRHPGDKPLQVTNTGTTFVGSFTGGEGPSMAYLWVSTASEGTPTTYNVGVSVKDRSSYPVNPADVALSTYPGPFLPIHNPAAQEIAFWSGQMAAEGGWHFVRGGMLYRGVASVEGEYDFDTSPRLQIFKTLQVQPNGAAFESARFAWAPDGDGYAVWDAKWSGTSEGDGFPDETRVYFGHLNNRSGLGPDQALDAKDTAGGRVVNVALGGGQYLSLTVLTDEGSEGGSFGPTAELRIVTRNLGDTADDVEIAGQDKVWVGPAVYPADLYRPN